MASVAWTPAQASKLILDIHIQGREAGLGGPGRKGHHGKGNQLSLPPQKTSKCGLCPPVLWGYEQIPSQGPPQARFQVCVCGLGFPTQITCTCRVPSSTGCRRKPQKPPRMCRCHGDPWALSRLPSRHLRQLTHPCTSLAWLVPGPGRRQQAPGNLRWPALASTLSLLDGASTGVQPSCGSPQSLCRPWSQN